jgi:hypothetical protein
MNRLAVALQVGVLKMIGMPLNSVQLIRGPACGARTVAAFGLGRQQRRRESFDTSAVIPKRRGHHFGVASNRRNDGQNAHFRNINGLGQYDHQFFQLYQ